MACNWLQAKVGEDEMGLERMVKGNQAWNENKEQVVEMRSSEFREGILKKAP